MERDLGGVFYGDGRVLNEPVVDFYAPPENFTPMYSFGQKISRDNFSAFVVDGFRRSQGVSAAHRDIIMFLDSRTDTQGLIEICRDFLTAGGWDVLNFEEQRYIFESYSRVRHNAMAEEMGIDLFGGHLMDEFATVLQPVVRDPSRFQGMTDEEFLKINRAFVIAEKKARAQILEGNLEALKGKVYNLLQLDLRITNE